MENFYLIKKKDKGPFDRTPPPPPPKKKKKKKFIVFRKISQNFVEKSEFVEFNTVQIRTPITLLFLA